MTTVGTYLGERLKSIGIGHYFAIPGDYNLTLLDELLKVPELKMISCCNELNAGYAADGYARAQGVAALCVTYSVGGLSAINAVAGAYSEDLPVIVISGSPNPESMAKRELLHHSLGKIDYDYVRDMFAPVTAGSFIVSTPSEAPIVIDRAIKLALTERKPVYIEVPCNIAVLPTSTPTPMDFKVFQQLTSDASSLAAAVEHAKTLLNKAVKPVLVGGVKLRSFGAKEAFGKLAQASHYPVACMPNAKGFFSETNPQYIGIYWGPVSSPGCAEVVESSDCYLFAGPTFTDYTTTGYSTLINPHKLIWADVDYVRIEQQVYNNVLLKDFLQALSVEVTPNDAALKIYQRIQGEAPISDKSSGDQPLTVRHLFYAINQLLTDDTALMIETGDSWFNGMRLKLPEKASYEFQMQYGSIGWCTGATLGYSVATHGKKRVIACIGDGSFQLTAQEVSTMIRYGMNPIIFLINNGGYTIEVEIHDGPYNVIKNWSYHQLISVFNAEDGKGWGTKVLTGNELDQAIAHALKHTEGPCLIEVMIDRNDCNKLLLQWGSRVSANNNKAPTLAT